MNFIEETNQFLRSHIAKLENNGNEKARAFEIVTNNWHTLAAEAEGLLADFTDVEGDGKDALERIKEIVAEIKGSTKTVSQIGLQNLPDAVKEPVQNADPPASAPSLTTPVDPENVHVSESGEVTVVPKEGEEISQNSNPDNQNGADSTPKNAG